MATQIDSLVKFVNSQGTTATGTLVQITRNNLVMEVYNPYSIVQLSEVLAQLCLRREEREVYKGRAVISTLVNTGLYLVVSATLIDPWKDLTGVERDGLEIRNEAARFLSDWEKNHSLRPEFQLTVLKIRSLLTELSRWLEQVDFLAEKDGVSHAPDLSKDVFEELKEPLLPKLYESLAEFEHQSGLIPKQELDNHRHFAQRDLHPLLLRSPFFWRAYNKPLGYAGDYEMVNMMLRPSEEGPTTYSKLINSLFLDASPPVVAHRNRIDVLVERLKEQIQAAESAGKPLKILNVGCGPAYEVQRLIKEYSPSVEVELHLLDFSEETLRHTHYEMTKITEGQTQAYKIEYLHKSVHQLLTDSVKKPQQGEGEYGFVYCAGLFDYLSDKVCTRLLRLFWAQTQSGGLVLATNVHSDNPFIYTMELLMEWHLIYRDEQGMNGLFKIQAEQKSYTDASGFNIFLEARK